jgi:chorismate synthase
MNRFGRIFQIQIYGESHGKGIGVIIDGVPSGIHLDEQDFHTDMMRRKAGGIGSTSRIEKDNVKILSGVYNHYTSGAPINLFIKNDNQRSKDYDSFVDSPRPGHADFTASEKYNNFNDYRGGGQFSGRMTAALTAAGVVAKKILNDIHIEADVQSIAGYEDYEDAVAFAARTGNTLGGSIACNITNLEVGLGEPFFDSIESCISHLVFSVPGIKAIEFGKGFSAEYSTGKEFNDSYINEEGETITNNAGGINGGISNGNDINFKVIAKPPSSIAMEQYTYSYSAHDISNLEVKGRHDISFAIRLPVVIEACAAIALADLKMLNCAIHKTTCSRE